MPRFTPDTNVRATTRVFDRGDYRLAIERHTPIIREKDDGSIAAGVLYGIKMVGKLDAKGKVTDEHAGEDVTPFTCWMHSSGAQSFTKRFLMAALGYKKEDEDKFDKDYWSNPKKDFTIDGTPEDASAGAAWEEAVGNQFVATLDKRIWNNQEQQDFASFMPAK